MGSRRVGHDWATSFSLFTFMHWRRKWQPTPVCLPGESQGGEPGGPPSMGSHRIRHDWHDLAAAAAAAWVYMYIWIFNHTFYCCYKPLPLRWSFAVMWSFLFLFQLSSSILLLLFFFILLIKKKNYYIFSTFIPIAAHCSHKKLNKWICIYMYVYIHTMYITHICL